MIGEDKKKSFLPFIFILLGLLLILFNFSESPSSKNHKIDEVQQQKVNAHLQWTQKKIEMDEAKAKMEMQKNLQTLPPGSGKNSRSSNKNLDLSYDKSSEEFAQSVERGSKPDQLPTDPNELIQTKIFQDQQLAEYTEAYKQEYVRRFIQNARNQGWDIKVNDQYKVISARPIRKPSQAPSVFSGNGSNSR